jgi:hypothetical protein
MRRLKPAAACDTQFWPESVARARSETGSTRFAQTPPYGSHCCRTSLCGVRTESPDSQFGIAIWRAEPGVQNAAQIFKQPKILAAETR